MHIARRTLTSISWTMVSNLSKSVVLFARSILLARLLPVEVFGVYGFAGSLIALTSVFANFGLDAAFMHRSEHTADEGQAARAHFTLKLLFTALWTGALLGGALLFTTGEQQVALVALTLTGAANHLTQTPKLILMRRIVHRRLAVLNIANALLTTAVSVGLAAASVTLWALLATDLVSLALSVFAMYLWKPVWRPALAWRPAAARYFVRFGAKNMFSALLQQALNEIDDLWTGGFLGQAQLGFYSRAYTFATYPRQVLGAPVTSVIAGAYAALKDDRRRLSMTFFRANALLVRVNFLFAGLLILIAPEFIRLALGAKWLPMLETFRLMLIFTLLDPLAQTIGYIFVMQGAPEKLARYQLVQLGVLVAGLFTLGSWLGIQGVALAMDAMLLTGITLMLLNARAYVDFSAWRLFSAPVFALGVGLLAGQAALTLPGLPANDWATAFAKALVFSLVYSALLAAFEYNRLKKIIAWAVDNLRRPDAEPT